MSSKSMSFLISVFEEGELVEKGNVQKMHVTYSDKVYGGVAV